MTSDPSGSAPTREPEQNTGPEQEVGPQPVPDARAELMRQIRRALILGGGLTADASEGASGFDPYNNRVAPIQGPWRVRRRD